MLNLWAIKVNARTGGGEGKTPVTMACPDDHWECKSSNYLSWKVKVMLKKNMKISGRVSLRVMQTSPWSCDRAAAIRTR